MSIDEIGIPLRQQHVSGHLNIVFLWFMTFTNLVNGVQSLTDSAVDNHHSCDIYIFSMFAENEKQKK